MRTRADNPQAELTNACPVKVMERAHEKEEVIELGSFRSPNKGLAQMRIEIQISREFENTFFRVSAIVALKMFGNKWPQHRNAPPLDSSLL